MLNNKLHPKTKTHENKYKKKIPRIGCNNIIITQ